MATFMIKIIFIYIFFNKLHPYLNTLISITTKRFTSIYDVYGQIKQVHKVRGPIVEEPL